MAGEKKNSNKSLIVLLCVLVVFSIGLGIGILVINLGDKNTTSKEDMASNDMSVSYDEYLSYIDEYDNAEIKFKDLTKKKPVDTGEIVSLISGYIKKYVDDGNIDRASSFVQLVEEVLMDADCKEELLEVMTSINLNVFTEADRYRYYSTIISLADDLGDNDILQRYTLLRKGVKAAYDAEYEGTEAAAEELEDEKDK